MDLFKMAELFFKFMMGQRSFISERSQEISVEILNQIRRVLILIVIILGAGALFCMGMSHLIERVLNQLDGGNFIFSNSIGVILFFLAICVGALMYSTNKKVWLDIFKKEAPVVAEAPSSIANTIESVVSLLVLDIIKEREVNRSIKKAASQDHCSKTAEKGDL